MYLLGEGVEKDPETAKNLMRFIEEEEKKKQKSENSSFSVYCNKQTHKRELRNSTTRNVSLFPLFPLFPPSILPTLHPHCGLGHFKSLARACTCRWIQPQQSHSSSSCCRALWRQRSKHCKKSVTTRRTRFERSWEIGVSLHKRQRQSTSSSTAPRQEAKKEEEAGDEASNSSEAELDDSSNSLQNSTERMEEKSLTS